MKIVVEYVRCKNYIASISNNLKKAIIDIKNNTVSVDTSKQDRKATIATLLNFGHPEVNSIKRFDKAKAKVRLVLGCAIGEFK